MNLLSGFIAAISLISGIVTIVSPIWGRYPQLRKFAFISTIVFLGIFILSIPLSPILIPSGNSGSVSSEAPPASNSNTTQGGSTSEPTPTPLPTDTPTPAPPSPGKQLFPTNGANWLDGWSGGSDWYTSGNMMLNTGQGINSVSLAPYHPGDNGISDYAVDVEMQLNSFSSGNSLNSFGIIVRSPDGINGYIFAVCVSAELTLTNCGTNDNEIYISNGSQNIAENPYLPHANDWHDYRMEVKGNSVKILIDGTEFLSATDNTYYTGGDVGLLSDESQITVRSFTVTAL